MSRYIVAALAALSFSAGADIQFRQATLTIKNSTQRTVRCAIASRAVENGQDNGIVVTHWATTKPNGSWTFKLPSYAYYCESVDGAGFVAWTGNLPSCVVRGPNHPRNVLLADNKTLCPQQQGEMVGFVDFAIVMDQAKCTVTLNEAPAAGGAPPPVPTN